MELRLDDEDASARRFILSSDAKIMQRIMQQNKAQLTYLLLQIISTTQHAYPINVLHRQVEILEKYGICSVFFQAVGAQYIFAASCLVVASKHRRLASLLRNYLFDIFLHITL
jgi:hypothetical protein